MLKRSLYIIFLLGITFGSAQELTLPTFTQYLADNPFVISPSYAGVGDHIKIRLNGLQQWVGIEDAPAMQSIAADGRIGERSGLGLLLYNDKNGNTRQNGARLSFAHHLTIDRYDDHFLSFGVSYVFNQFRIKIEDLNTTGDAGITDDRRTANHNFDVGMLYRYGKFFISANAANILNKDLNEFGFSEPGKIRNYYIYSGYKWRKSKRSSLEIEPSVFFQWFEGDGRSVTDFSIKVKKIDFQDYYWAGFSYRFLNDQIGSPLNLGPMLGMKKKGMYFAYTYQIILNDIISYNSGTHMITVGFDIFQGLSNCRCMY